MPTDRKSIKIIERYSPELARESVIGIDATLKNRLVKVVSDQLDDALVAGRGAATNEVQTVTAAAGGNPFTVGFRGALTSSLANNAPATAVDELVAGGATVQTVTEGESANGTTGLIDQGGVQTGGHSGSSQFSALLGPCESGSGADRLPPRPQNLPRRTGVRRVERSGAVPPETG